MSAAPIIAVALELGSATLVNLAYLREHDAAAALPSLSLRRPLHSLGLLLADRGWLLGSAMETGGFALYTAALALAPLALVQAIGAGGLGILAFATSRLSGRRLSRRQVAGVALSTAGLLFLAISLAKNSANTSHGAAGPILAWLGATAAVALMTLAAGRRGRSLAVAEGAAGGLFFSVGDISTKLATQGGARFAFVLPLIVGYTVGTSLLQLGYQRGGALTVAGIAGLLTTALPIAAGTIVLHEAVPSGALGVLRIVSFVVLTLGAVLLARPDDQGPSVPNQSAPASRSGGGA